MSERGQSALVIEPGHGSVWLHDVQVHGDLVEGWIWDESGVGSSLLPDDFRGERLTMNFPLRWVLRWEIAA